MTVIKSSPKHRKRVNIDRMMIEMTTKTAPTLRQTENEHQEPAAETLEEWKPRRSELWIMISLSVISLMVALDATILVTVLPQIAESLNGTAVEAFWAGTSYLLTSAIFQPVIASVSALFGRQQLLFVSLALFTIGTILCSVSENFTVLLTGRCIQGIGGGGIISLTQVVFCDLIPLRQRPKYFAMVLGAWSVGSIIGPVIGGALVEQASWRWCFHINYPFCGIGFVVTFAIVRLTAVAELKTTQKLKKTDFLGIFLFIIGMTSFLIGISWGGIQYPWRSAATLVPVILGVAVIAVFSIQQRHRSEDTILPLQLFSSRSALAAFYLAFINGLILFSSLYYYPFYEMSARSSSPIDAGIDLFPTVFLLIPGSLVVSILTSRFGKFRWAVWGGWALTTVACGLQLLYDTDTRKAVLGIVLAIFGIGSGMVLTSVNIAIQAISQPQDAAMAAGMYTFFRSLGMPLGVTLSSTAFQNAMSRRLAALDLPTTIARDSERYVQVLRDMASSPQKDAILDSYMQGFRAVFILMAAFAFSALVVSLFIKSHSMDKILLAQFRAW